MEKIYKLKKWLDLEETAQRLSLELNKEITIADILQIAIDGHLKISVYFPHDWKGKFCNVTTDHNIVIQSRKETIGIDGSKFVYFEYEKCSETEYIKISPEINLFNSGVWELKLIGRSKIDLERELKSEKGLTDTEVFNLSGFYVKDKDGIVIERQTYSHTTNSNIKKYNIKKEIDKGFYYPCAGLEEIEGTFLVVQTEHINEFINSLSDDDCSNNLTIDNALYLIGEILNVVKSKARQWTQSTIIDEILLQRQNQNKTVQGLEQRKIEEYFSKANKKLKSE